ncbi:MAG: hypothetical protein ACPLZD_06265 [Candidatus Saccharicenans sp.]|nr:MAG: hypothetical protein C0168_09280 [Candidatus Aminicenantes bacterium]HEK84749.1 hypothetical protein [Candidatus Aminicenantes bacterium]
MVSQKMFIITALSLFLICCFGAGRQLVIDEPVAPVSYDQAWEIALNSAREMCEEGKKINPYNFPVLVSLGTSKSRDVITLRYDFDPAAGSIGTEPPNAAELIAKKFVPRFGAEFYIHIKLIKSGQQVNGVKIEVTQMKGVKKEEFDREADKVKDFYLQFLKKNWVK